MGLEMARRGRALAALVEDLGLVPSTHMWFSRIHFRESNISPLLTTPTPTHTHTHPHVYSGKPYSTHKLNLVRLWWGTPLILAPKTQRQEDLLVYRPSSRTARATQRNLVF